MPREALVRLFGLGAAITAGLTATVSESAATWLHLRGPTCPLGSCLGRLVCPGCGLVRSTAAALQGDFGFAVRMHPAGPIVAALLVAGVLLHFDILRRRRECAVHRDLRRIGQRCFVVALGLGWLLRLGLT